MAVTTKSSSVSIAVGTSNAASGTTTGTEVDCSTYLAEGVMVRLTNGGTGPTIAATADVQIRESGTGNWRSFTQFTHSTTASAVTDYYVTFPPEIIRVRVVVSGNTAQAVTCEAIVYYISAIS